MKEAGVYLRFAKPAPGRERETLALFAETVEYLTAKRTEGLITWFEPFMFDTADYEEEAGFFVIRGPAEGILRMVGEERWMNMVSKAVVLCSHVKVATLRVGDAVTEQMERLGKVYAELGV